MCQEAMVNFTEAFRAYISERPAERTVELEHGAVVKAFRGITETEPKRSKTQHAQDRRDVSSL